MISEPIRYELLGGFPFNVDDDAVPTGLSIRA